jgi:hypothetical protein
VEPASSPSTPLDGALDNVTFPFRSRLPSIQHTQAVPHAGRRVPDHPELARDLLRAGCCNAASIMMWRWPTRSGPPGTALYVRWPSPDIRGLDGRARADPHHGRGEPLSGSVPTATANSAICRKRSLVGAAPARSAMPGSPPILSGAPRLPPARTWQLMPALPGNIEHVVSNTCALRTGAKRA